MRGSNEFISGPLLGPSFTLIGACAESASGPAAFYEVAQAPHDDEFTERNSMGRERVHLTCVGSFNVFQGGTLPAVRVLGDTTLAVVSSSG
jgi:hypothetical protein